MNCDVERKQDSGTRAMTMFSYVRTPVNNTFVTKKMLSFMLSICFNSSFWNHGPGCWQINEVHEQFIVTLRELFEKYKGKAGYPGLHLRVLWHSSTKLQLGFSNNKVALRCSPWSSKLCTSHALEMVAALPRMASVSAVFRIICL